MRSLKARSNAARDRVREGQAPKTRKIMEGLDANPYTTKSDANSDTTRDFAGIRTRDPTSPRRGVLHIRSRDVPDTALHLLIYLKSEKGRASVMLGGEEGERGRVVGIEGKGLKGGVDL